MTLPPPQGADVLETARLWHRPVTADDLPWLARLYADPTVMRYLGHGRPRPLEESERAVASIIETHRQHGLGLYGTILKETGAPIGRCGYVPWPDQRDGELEVAWLIDPAHQGRGYATEAARLFCELVWRRTQRDYIVSYIRAENTSSIRVAEKAGLRHWEERRLGSGNIAQIYRMDRPASG